MVAPRIMISDSINYIINNIISTYHICGYIHDKHLLKDNLFVNKYINSICKKNKHYNTLIMIYSLISRDAALLKKALNNNADIYNHNTYDNYSLITAVEENFIEGVQVILDYMAPTQIFDSISLCYACENGNLEIVKMLIRGGANPATFNYEPLLLAKMNGHKHIIEYLDSIDL